MTGRIDVEATKLRFQSLFFVQFAAFSGFAVFRNVYLEGIGMSGAAMGTIGFLMTATGVVAQPGWGVITDYWRAERPVIVVGAVVSGGALLSYPFGAGLASPFLVVAAGTALFSAFRAPIVPVANGMILSRGYDYGNVRAFGSIAFGIGSLGFGFLVAALGVVSVVYFYVGGMVVLAAVALSIPAGEDEGTGGHDRTDGDGEAATSEASLWTALRALVTAPTFLVVLATAFLLRLSASGGSAFFSVYMRAIDAGIVVGPWSLSADALTGLAWAIKTGFEAVAFVYAVRLSLPYRWLLAGGGVALVAPNLVYGLTTAPAAILAVQVAGGVGYALFTLAAVELAYAVADRSVRSTAQTALAGVGLGLGGAVGQVVAGGLMDAVGLRRMYVAVAVVGVLGAAVGLLVTDRGRLDGETGAAGGG